MELSLPQQRHSRLTTVLVLIAALVIIGGWTM